MLKRTFKVISPIERRDGNGVWWMRCGNAFTNKDESINVYLDAMPAPGKDGFKLQLRELTEEELRERAEKRTSYTTRATANHIPANTMASPGDLPF